LIRFLLFFVKPSKSGINEAHWSLKLVFTLILICAAVYLLYEINYPFGPYPFFFIDTKAYLLLNMIFLIGTALPLVWATYAHIEDFPLAPGGRMSKAVNTAFSFFAAWGIATCVVRGIQFILIDTSVGRYTPMFVILEAGYFFYLLNSSAITVFNLKMKKALLSAIPCIAFYLLLPLEITLVRSWVVRSVENPFEKTTPLGYLLLIFLALIPLMLIIIANVLKSGGRSIATSEKFSRPIMDTDQPEQMYQQSLTLINMGKKKQALKLLDDVIAKANYKPDVLFQRARLLLEMKDPEGAARDMENYLEVKKRNVSVEPYILLIESYRALEEWDNVIDVTNELLDKFPTHMQGWFFKAEALKKSGEENKAVLTLKEMQERWGDVPRYRHPLEREWLEKGKNMLQELNTPKK
jgi:tetratricopeptide (TPR) repeat protein